MNIYTKPSWNTFALVSTLLVVLAIVIIGYLVIAPTDPGTPVNTEFLNETGQAKTSININGCLFMPSYIRVSLGTQVTWTNYDAVTHAIVVSAYDKAGVTLTSSPVLNKNDTFSFTFDQPGRYDYICSIHPKMYGSIIVEP